MKSEILRSVFERLGALYGIPKWERSGPALDELIQTVLSQNTNDRNSSEGFRRLKAAFPNWEAVEKAPARRVAAAIRVSGLSNTKSVRIQEMLRRIRKERGAYSLEFLKNADASVGAGVPALDPRRRAEDGGVRAALLVRQAGVSGGHAYSPRHAAAGHPGPEGQRRRGAPAVAGAGPGGDRLPAAPAADPARARDVPRAEPGMRRTACCSRCARREKRGCAARCTARSSSAGEPAASGRGAARHGYSAGSVGDSAPKHHGDGEDVLEHGVHGGITVVAVARHAAKEDVLERDGDVAVPLARVDRLAVQVDGHLAEPVRIVRERPRAGEDFEHAHAEGIHVRPRVHFLPAHLLRRHVGRRAGAIVAPLVLQVRGDRQAEVNDLRRAVLRQQDVLRAEIAVDEAVLVDVGQPARDLDRRSAGRAPKTRGLCWSMSCLRFGPSMNSITM